MQGRHGRSSNVMERSKARLPAAARVVLCCSEICQVNAMQNGVLEENQVLRV